MKMKRIPFLLLIGVLMFAFTGILAAQDSWPKPVSKWWTQLEGGEKATFEMDMGQMVMTMEITIDKVDGSKITMTNRSSVGENTMPEQTQTVDAVAETEEISGIPAGSSVNKGKSDTFTAGSTKLDYTVYDLTVEGEKMTVWHSKELPPIFSGGNVWMETSTAQGPITVKLTDYQGTLLN